MERLVLDFYLGGATLYLVAAIQVGAFVRPVVVAVPVVAAAVVVYRVFELWRRGTVAPAREPLLRGLFDPWVGIAFASAVGLFVVELAAALPAATGNTYDSSLLTTYVALLLQHGSVPLSFQPYGSPAILYPQGATVWLGWAQLVFGLPPARTALLVTPLFLGLTPLAGYVLGRRLIGGSKAAATFALALAWLGPSTRALVGGSNDFALALPLVLLLAAQSTVWTARRPAAWGDAIGFGALLGYSAVVNVVGAEWLLPAIVLLGAFASPRFGGRALGWFARWAGAAAAAAVPGVPSLVVLARARWSPMSLAGALSAPSGSPVGIDVAQLIGSVDPLLFRAGDVELSPIPFVRLELAVLLVLGVGALVGLVGQRPRAGPWLAVSKWTLAAGASIAIWLGILVAAGVPGSPVRVVGFLSSAAELSLALFTVYGLVAAVPLALAFDRWRPPEPGPADRAPRRGRRRTGLARSFVPVAFAVVVVVPGVVLTPTSLGSVLSVTYADFGNVSGADFDMLTYASGHIGPGARVLVAPGSAAEFLPGYVRGIVLLYPMAPGWNRENASYTLVLQELTNGTLDPAGLRALASLDVDLIVVTGNNTDLWPAFWASPLREAGGRSTPTFPVVWNEADAWIFNATGCRLGLPGCS